VYDPLFFCGVTQSQTCTAQKTQRAKLSTPIRRGPQKSISFQCRDFVTVWQKFWNDNYLFEVTLL